MTPTEHDPISDSLRRPAPDEPATLPPLAIDLVAASPVRPGAVGPTGRRRSSAWPLAVVGVAVLAVVAWQTAMPAGLAPSPSASVGPTPVPSTPSGPSAGPGQLATFKGGGISFEYPANWKSHGTIFARSTMGSTIAIVGTVDLGGCGLIDVDINCAYAAQLKPEDVIVFVGTGASPGGSILTMAPPGGFTDFIDGMPAVATSTGPIPQNGQEAGRSWTIGMPLVENNWYTVSGSLRGPDVPALEAQVDAVARSIRFDQPAPSLPTDPVAIDAILRTAIDALDRGARESNHSEMYGCFPRAVGTSAPTTIEDGPGGPLAGPLVVTCGVAVEPTLVGLFAITLTVHWDAGPGYAAGTFQQVNDVDGQGALGSQRTLTDSQFPATRPDATPGPATTPIALAPGSLVEVLRPGVTFYETPDLHGNSLSDLPFGERVWIVDGPRRVGSEDWYLVQWQPTPVFDGIPGWIPATLEGHPVVAPTSARCPAAGVGVNIDVNVLVGLIPAERLACFGSQPITIGPVILGPRTDTTVETSGSPGWLTTTPTIAMYGSGGPAGVDLPLLVRGDPSMAASLPLDTWLEVTGHYDHATAAGCKRSWIGDAGSTPITETPAEQVLSCREQFVITAVRPVASP